MMSPIGNSFAQQRHAKNCSCADCALESLTVWKFVFSRAQVMNVDSLTVENRAAGSEFTIDWS